MTPDPNVGDRLTLLVGRRRSDAETFSGVVTDVWRSPRGAACVTLTAPTGVSWDLELLRVPGHAVRL